MKRPCEGWRRQSLAGSAPWVAGVCRVGRGTSRGDFIVFSGLQILQTCESFRGLSRKPARVFVGSTRNLCLPAAVGESRKTALNHHLESTFRSRCRSHGTATMIIRL